MSKTRLRPFSISKLRRGYESGTLEPSGVLDTVLSRIRDAPAELWIARIDESVLRDRVAALEAHGSDGIDWEQYPLYGVPFAVKDNIDHGGTPTTAGCPAYEYVPETDATVVERLLDAGAVLVGKTNLDQFATGLVGTRSPYGACPNAVDPEYISGGSSSGSAVAVALDIVPFALGTDTAGSGRVPAALNGVVGLKPSRGLLSTSGVVPACESLDCVAVFANTCEDALAVARATAGFDSSDRYARRRAETVPLEPGAAPSDPVVGIPRSEQLEFFGDEAARACFEQTVEWFDGQYTTRTVDLAPFVDAGQLLYEGPWVAERLSAVEPFVSENPDALLPVTRRILTRGREFDAMDVFEAQHELRRLRQQAESELAAVTAVLTPTTGTTYRRETVRERPVEPNSRLGYYTNFMNLLDLAAVAVPAGQYPSGLPFGVTLFADAFEDAVLADIAETYCRERAVEVGARAAPYNDIPAIDSVTPSSNTTR